MRYLLNLLYLALLTLAAPFLLYKALTTGKYRRGMLAKVLGLTPRRAGGRPCAWFHAVSVGEVQLLRPVIGRFRERYPAWECVLSTTTDTGMEVARKSYPDLTLCWWPLDFSWAVSAALRRLRPDLVVLAELELWPNFVAAARRAGCPVAVVNGRMSPRSFRGYRRMRAFMARLLGKISLLAVQNEDYASRLRDLGAPAERIVVTGSVKYDGVHGDRANPRTQELARLFGIGPGERVWVAGSTQAPEEAVVLEIYRRLRADFPDLRLILVPRHRERFEEVAGLLAASGLPFVRRSALPDERRGSSPPSGGVILGDTMGELSAVWGLADVAFVGGSLGDRGGQNMIEPAAYGAAVTFGPNTWNFRETVERLLEQEAAVQVADAAALERETRRFLADVVARMELGRRARAFVLSQQGAVEHTLDALARVVPGLPGANRAAA